MRMLQAGGGADLGEKTFASERRTEIGMQHFDGHITVMFDVVRKVHSGHAALTDLALYAVTVGECGSESGAQSAPGNGKTTLKAANDTGEARLWPIKIPW